MHKLMLRRNGTLYSHICRSMKNLRIQTYPDLMLANNKAAQRSLLILQMRLYSLELMEERLLSILIPLQTFQTTSIKCPLALFQLLAVHQHQTLTT